MAMQIQTNLAALFAQRSLGQTTNDTQRVIQRLGSGLRIIDPALGSLNLSVEAWSIVHG